MVRAVAERLGAGGTALPSASYTVSAAPVPTGVRWAALKQMGMQVRGQALVMAFSDVFYVLAIAFGCLVFLVPLVQRPKAAAGGGGGH